MSLSDSAMRFRSALRPLAGVRWLVPSVIISLSTAWSPATASDIRSNAVPLSLVEPIKPLPLRANEDRRRASLGRQLFKYVRPVDVMFMYQLSRVATKEDKLAIIGFLNTLTGDVPDAP
jgi:hypothetical protein